MTDAAQPPTIVVGFDGREPAEHALAEAIASARDLGGRVVAVVVGQLPVVADPYAFDGISYEYVGPLSAEGPVEIQPLLAAAREQIEAGGVPGEAVWGLGDPASEILRVAEETKAVRIVVGHHHHSALGRLFGTDIDARIEEEAGCDVVVVNR